nr:PREDICTED: probable flap endonuclease 1 homolog isoform X1 [Anolis carolinensis]|eukprot:XP_016854077.1 PREDICTED: probable flap endonuclease 1 homolog isoform X1 [Anolis carolinensis]
MLRGTLVQSNGRVGGERGLGQALLLPLSPSRRGPAMGIVKLAELVEEAAPEAVRTIPLERYRDQVVALDASVAISQFRTAMPPIINRHGQNISLLQGLFYRTLHLLKKGIRPVFVFDGKPPDLKRPVLAKRAAISGASKDAADLHCFPDPTTSGLPQRLPKQDYETLLSCLGVPYVQAPAEAEATCAALVKAGLASATATEDMDALPFGSLRLLRHLNTKNGTVEEISLPVLLEKLSMTQEQFVDLCILLGCDYCEKIRGLGPKKALKLLRQHGSIEKVVEHTSRQKHPLPDNWPLAEARTLFLDPVVAPLNQVALGWSDPDEERLVCFLAHEKHMNERRVRHAMEKWRESLPKLPEPVQPRFGAEDGSQQSKMENFFQVKKRQRQVLRSPLCRKKPKQQPETAVGT